MRADPKNLFQPIGGQEPLVARLPKRPYQRAIGQLVKTISDVEVDYDHFGQVRHLTTSSNEGFLSAPFAGKPLAHARKLLRTRLMRSALGLSKVELRDGEVTELDLPVPGWRVEFRQVLRIKGQKRAIKMRGGYIHVFMSDSGRIYMVNSTLRHGRKPAALGKVISREAAIKAALEKHGVQTCETARCQLTYSAHDGSIDPVYEVLLSSCNPKKLVLYLVQARTGEVVYAENKLHYASAKARSFLRIPNPSVDLEKQIFDTVIDMLPNPAVLKNENLVVYMGDSRREVKARADGSFNYSRSEIEFDCVVTFWALNQMYELFKKWGMRKADKPCPVHVHAKSVRDNAYFDPDSDLIKLGVGSGLRRGLNVHIAYDLGVGLHETGHRVVYIQTPGKDLPGSEGGATHEACGDYCDILFDFWFRLLYGKQMRHELTREEVNKDPRIIGVYALPPNGIRQQKNNKKTPRDKTGEVHDDGEIIGGAMCDVLVGLAVRPESRLEDAFVSAGKLFLAALALVPAHKVMFKDILRAFVTADQNLNNGTNRALIEKCFADHGIALGARISDPDQTVVVVKPRRRKRA